VRILVPDSPAFKSLHDSAVDFVPYARDGEIPTRADGVVMLGVPRAHRQKLLALPGLKWALTLTAGVDHITSDLPAGVALFNASDLHADAVAQHAVATLLSAARGLHLARDFQRERTWGRFGVFSGAERAGQGLGTLAGRHVVIWGYGHIGRRLEAYLVPFGARVTGLRSSHSPYDVNSALADADVAVLLLPSTPGTKGIVNADVLSRLKPGAWLANYGRGELVVTDDLVGSLHAGHLGGAILDVTNPEPLPAESPLWEMPNVIITPHVAAATSDIEQRAAAFTADFVRQLVRGDEPPNRVDVSRGY